MELFEHNKRHYDALMGMLETERRACGIQPPGTGKSYIAFNIAIEHPGERVLWLSPSDYIFAQQIENIRKDCPQDDVSNVAQLTYASAMAMAKDGRALPSGFEWVVLDEFHHCLAPEWGKGVAAVLAANPDAKVVGLTATRIRYSDGERDAAEEMFGANVAFEMGIEEAWFLGILPIPKYVSALYDAPSELEELERRAAKGGRGARDGKMLASKLRRLRRMVDEAGGVGDVISRHLGERNAKVIVFCPNIGQLNSISAKRREWFGGVNDDIRAYEVYHSNPMGEDDFAAFKADRGPGMKVLYCVDQLNEGVHIDDVDAVVMVRATASPTIFMQQLGRALDAGRSSHPVVFDLVNNSRLMGLGSLGGGVQRAFDELVEQDPGAVRFAPSDLVVYDEVRDFRELVDEINECMRPAPMTLAEQVDRLVELAGL